MFLIKIFVIILLSHSINGTSKKKEKSAIERVRVYFNSRPKVLVTDTNWLQNSNKIGLGYDLVKGSPACYTGQCQMEGFRQPVFKLDITKEPVGSCTHKLIPQNVNILCLSSTQLTANTESISTLDQLQKTTKSSLELSGSIGIDGNSFSYGFSTEIRSMIDTMVQLNSTIFFTRATINWVRLTAFVPRLQLSDDFMYVIEHMPCCQITPTVEKYIQEFFIDHFGTMYMNDLLLGGIAQQKIVVSEENRKQLNSNGFTNSNEAEFKTAAAIVFSVSAKLKVTDQFDQTKINAFNRYSQQSSITTLGGDPILQSIEDWSKTIPSNPTVVKFSIAPIIDLLTSTRFPRDSNIDAKRQMIIHVQDKYKAILTCYHNCAGHGQCVPTGYFGFGQCRCNAGWSGTDCSVTQQVHTGLASFPSNQQCSTGNRAERVFVGIHSTNSMLRGSTFIGGVDVKVQFCFLTTKNAVKASLNTLCGWVYAGSTVLCGGMNPRSEPCPSGYAKRSVELIPRNHPAPPEYGAGTPIWTCLKSDTSVMDLPGTICGLHTNFSPETLVECSGYNPGQGKCPPGFTHRKTNYIIYKRMLTVAFDFCAKN